MAGKPAGIELWPAHTRLDHAWRKIPQPRGTPFYWNQQSRESQYNPPPFHFMSTVVVEPNATIHIESPYDRAILKLSFPNGCAANQWFAVPVSGTPAAPDPQQLAQQQLEQQQTYQQRLQAHQQAQLAAAEAEKQRREAIEYEMDDPDSDLQNAADVEIFESYKPQKLGYGRPHPDPVVEAACLSIVESPDVTLMLRLQNEQHPASQALSDLQLEAITYACQRFKVTLPSGARAGFFISDGAGACCRSCAPCCCSGAAAFAFVVTVDVAFSCCALVC